MSKKLLIVVFAVAVFGVFAFYLLRQTLGESNPATMTVQMNDYSDSGQSGGATISESNSKVTVKLELSGTQYDKPQPAHIHSGGCPRIGPIVYQLEDVVGGVSTTVLDTTIADLLAKSDQLNVNVHHSYDDFKTYTSCGDIK